MSGSQGVSTAQSSRGKHLPQSLPQLLAYSFVDLVRSFLPPIWCSCEWKSCQKFLRAWVSDLVGLGQGEGEDMWEQTLKDPTGAASDTHRCRTELASISCSVETRMLIPPAWPTPWGGRREYLYLVSLRSFPQKRDRRVFVNPEHC